MNLTRPSILFIGALNKKAIIWRVQPRLDAFLCAIFAVRFDLALSLRQPPPSDSTSHPPTHPLCYISKQS